MPFATNSTSCLQVSADLEKCNASTKNNATKREGHTKCKYSKNQIKNRIDNFYETSIICGPFNITLLKVVCFSNCTFLSLPIGFWFVKCAQRLWIACQFWMSLQFHRIWSWQVLKKRCPSQSPSLVPHQTVTSRWGGGKRDRERRSSQLQGSPPSSLNRMGSTFDCEWSLNNTISFPHKIIGSILNAPQLTCPPGQVYPYSEHRTMEQRCDTVEHF